MPMSKGITDVDLEWEKRTLCSDGSCIGVIGADGRCKECGKAYDGDLPVMLSDIPEEELVSDSVDNRAADSEHREQTVAEEGEDIDSEWETRRLCSDGSCIGVIGADGRCKECGKLFEG
jgi:hypothetical protein